MSKHIHYVKDSRVFPVVIEDFASVMDGRERTRNIGFSGAHFWEFTFKRVIQNQIPLLKVTLCFVYDEFRRNSLEVHYGFFIGSRHAHLSQLAHSRAYLESHQLVQGEFLLEPLLDEKNGFLENGELKIQVEIRVNVIINQKGIRTFNFEDPFEGCVTLSTMDSWSTFYASERFLTHHSSYFKKRIRKGRCDIPACWYDVEFETVLQLAHGVRLLDQSITSDSEQCALLMEIIHRFRFHNFLQYFTHELKKSNAWWQTPIHLLPSRYAKTLLDSVRDVQDFSKCVTELSGFLKKMNSKLLKAIIEKFFSFVVDNDDND